MLTVPVGDPVETVEPGVNYAILYRSPRGSKYFGLVQATTRTDNPPGFASVKLIEPIGVTIFQYHGEFIHHNQQFSAALRDLYPWTPELEGQLRAVRNLHEQLVHFADELRSVGVDAYALDGYIQIKADAEQASRIVEALSRAAV